jgi:2-polyprenyl-6-methoxyphenol hydroxylase-like FAD-dependent oxidoreductase
VVVVGAGPCGAALALLLARAGWAVTLVEASQPGGARPYRGEGLMPSGVAALEAMALWPLPTGVRQRPLSGWAVVLERQPLFTVAEPLVGDRGCWLVDQVSLLAHLRAELEGLSGTRLLEGVAVRGLVRADGAEGRGLGRSDELEGRAPPGTAGGARARGLPGAAGGQERAWSRADGRRGRVVGVRLADGTEVAADLVVACDGRHSPLRRQVGLMLQGEREQQPERDGERALEPEGPQEWRRGQDLHGQARGVERGEPQQREQVLWFRLAGPAVAPLAEWLAGRFLTVVGAGVSFALFAEAAGEALRLGWVAEAGVALPVDGAGWRECWALALPEEAAALTRALPLAAIEGPQRFPVRVGWAPRWHVPGLLLLGDAAHPMSPVRAQGINMALRDALVVARLLGPLAGPPADPPGADAQLASATASAGEGARQAPGDDRATIQAPIDALLPRIAAQRLPEIRRLQALQAREAGLGVRLRQLGWLRRALATSAPWSGPLARRRWIQQQHRLRLGLPGALALPK